MCDTAVALANSTKDGSVLFAKNSDRDPNEAHEVIMIPRQEHASRSIVKCTYVEIPQVRQTYQVLLCKPFWIWGAEMGSNEFGVTIGNEALFTRLPYGKEPGLIGMDFLRLALERAETAEKALETITSLLDTYGQSGNCGFAHPMYYHNSFLICDPKEAWVLETAGKEWAAEKVQDIRSISNGITIGNHWDKASKTLVSVAIQKGWCKSEADFSFARCYSDPLYTRFSDANNRQVCTTKNLQASKGEITPELMMELLRTHSVDRTHEWRPDHGIIGADVCMHSGWGPVRLSQTTGSLVTHITEELTTHWVTGTAAPCTSIFKPLWLDSGVPDFGKPPKGNYSKDSMFWKHEEVHRAILVDYTERIKLIKPEQREIEQGFLDLVRQVGNKSESERAQISLDCYNKSDALETKWVEKTRQHNVKTKNTLLFKVAWEKNNKAAKMPD
jgi:dipeptidase